MSAEDQFRAALDHAGATLARHLEADVRAIADQLSSVAAAEREAAVTAATEQAASQARAVADAHQAELQALTEQHAEDLKRARAEIERAQADAEQATLVAVAGMRAELDEADLGRSARLADSVRAVDDANNLSEVLERLTQRAGLEVDRVTLFLVREGRLTGWRFAGFDGFATVPSPGALAPADAGIAGAAFERGIGVSSRTDSTGDPRPVFLQDGDPRVALALPIRVDGEVVAVLYADDPDRASTTDAPWASALNVLALHASRVLEAMTVRQLTETLEGQFLSENAR